jgi:hypothetical protein
MRCAQCPVFREYDPLEPYGTLSAVQIEREGGCCCGECCCCCGRDGADCLPCDGGDGTACSESGWTRVPEGRALDQLNVTGRVVRVTVRDAQPFEVMRRRRGQLGWCCTAGNEAFHRHYSQLDRSACRILPFAGAYAHVTAKPPPATAHLLLCCAVLW